MKKTATQFGKLAANSDSVDYRSLATGLGGLTVGSMPALSAAEIIKNAPNIYRQKNTLLNKVYSRKIKEFADTLQPGDVIIEGVDHKAPIPKNMFGKLYHNLENIGTINPQHAHAYQVFRSPDGQLVAQLPSGGLVDGRSKALRSRSVAAELVLSKLKKRQFGLQQIKNPKQLFASFRQDLGTIRKILAMSAGAKTPLTPEAVAKGLAESSSVTDMLTDLLRNNQTVTIMRPTKQLAESDLLKKLQTVGATSFGDIDVLETGVRRALAPTRLAGLFGGKTPTTCSGSVCSVLGGGSVSGSIPTDLVNSKAFKHIATMSKAKAAVPKAKQLAAVLRAAGVRGLLAAPFLGLGAYHLSKSMPSK